MYDVQTVGIRRSATHKQHALWSDANTRSTNQSLDGAPRYLGGLSAASADERAAKDLLVA